MKPLILLIIVFVVSLLLIRAVTGSFDYLLAGRIAMSAMLIFTAMGHFVYTRGMEMMLPSFLPYKQLLVQGTGFLEVAAAIGLLVPGWTKITGWLLMLFFLLIVPANIQAALQHIDYQKGTYEGPGATYLWFRIPLQVLFITWVYVVAIHHFD